MMASKKMKIDQCKHCKSRNVELMKIEISNEAWLCCSKCGVEVRKCLPRLPRSLRTWKRKGAFDIEFH